MTAWNETDDYRQAHTAYVADVAAAVAGEQPDLGRLQADNRWLTKQAELRDAHAAREGSQAALAEARTAAKTAHPHIPDAILERAQTPEDVAAITAALADLKPAASAATTARPTGRSRSAAGGPPPSTPSAPASTDPGDGESGRKWKDRDYMTKLIDDANAHAGDGTGRPSKAVEEFMELFMDNRVFTQMGFTPDGNSAIS